MRPRPYDPVLEREKEIVRQASDLSASLLISPSEAARILRDGPVYERQVLATVPNEMIMHEARCRGLIT